MADKFSRDSKYWWFGAWDHLINRMLRCAGVPKIESAPGSVALDPHIHTRFSHCSISDPERIIRWAVKLGLGAVGIMDHNRIDGARETARCADSLKSAGAIPEDFFVILGVELNTTRGHVGALFVEEELPQSLDPVRTVQAIHDAGGLAVAVHPFHSTGVGDAVFDAPFDAVEVQCGSMFGRRSVKRTLDLFSDPRLASVTKIGSSDAHYINAIGTCYTILRTAEPTVAAAREALLSGRCSGMSSEPCSRLRRLLGLFPKLH